MSASYLGDFPIGATIYVPFATYDKDDGSSITMTGFATTDVNIYKNGNMTQRASANGITLLDTDGTDIDGITGIHGFSIDTSDNSTSGFYTGGADYWVIISSITADGVTVNFIAAIFSIENRRVAGELLSTTIATLESQTSFTLTAGSADNNAYVDCLAVVSDIASGVQKCFGYVSAYTGSTKTVTLSADPGIFTMAAGDNIRILSPGSVSNVSTSAKAAVADKLLGRNVAGGSDGGRSVTQALYAQRNKVTITGSSNPYTMTVYATDDSTTSWTASVTISGGKVTDVDPA